MDNKKVEIHDFSYTLYRWAYDYFNSVNELAKSKPGRQMFAVKYNNACLALELIIKSHIAYKKHAEDIDALDKILRSSYGHSLVKLSEYAVENIGLELSQEDLDKIKVVDQYYSTHRFRYPPYEPRKSNLNHQELLEAIEKMRKVTQMLLVIVHESTNGFQIDQG